MFGLKKIISFRIKFDSETIKTIFLLLSGGDEKWIRFDFLMFTYREAAKKISSTNGQAIKAFPPPLELNGHWNFFFP